MSTAQHYTKCLTPQNQCYQTYPRMGRTMQEISSNVPVLRRRRTGPPEPFPLAALAAR